MSFLCWRRRKIRRVVIPGFTNVSLEDFLVIVDISAKRSAGDYNSKQRQRSLLIYLWKIFLIGFFHRRRCCCSEYM